MDTKAYIYTNPTHTKLKASVIRRALASAGKTWMLVSLWRQQGSPGTLCPSSDLWLVVRELRSAFEVSTEISWESASVTWTSLPRCFFHCRPATPLKNRIVKTNSIYVILHDTHIFIISWQLFAYYQFWDLASTSLSFQ